VTHRGPFQPLPFCDSVKTFTQPIAQLYLLPHSTGRGGTWPQQTPSLLQSIPASGVTESQKQGHLQQAAQDLVQAGLEYLQRQTAWPSPAPLEPRQPPIWWPGLPGQSPTAASGLLRGPCAQPDRADSMAGPIAGRR